MADPGNVYDICVVGAGTFGSAAARHIVETQRGLKVLLVGPIERKDRSSTDIHSAHDDEGRVTRIIETELIWTELGRRSVARYRDIERRSGIPFYDEVGYLDITMEGDKYVEDMQESVFQQGQSILVLDKEQLDVRFPFFTFKDGEIAVYMDKHSGYINIRKMVLAQRRLAQLSGCDVRDDIIRRVIEPSVDNGYNTIITDDGSFIYSKKVLLATGAFTHCRQLLPRGLVPDIENQAEGVVLLEVPDHRLRRFAGMPAIVHLGMELQEGLHTYILPPIRYPDGKHYIKLGHGKVRPEPVKTREQIHSWYNRKQTGYIERYLSTLVEQYFPNLVNNPRRYDYCVTAHTPSGYPYIDMVTSSLGVVLGGNGCSAKCGDELGRVAARMICRGAWDSDFPHEVFRFKSTQNTSSKL